MTYSLTSTWYFAILKSFINQIHAVENSDDTPCPSTNISCEKVMNYAWLLKFISVVAIDKAL